MAEARRKFGRDFTEGAVRLVEETGTPAAQVARGPGISDGALLSAVAACGGRGQAAGG